MSNGLDVLLGDARARAAALAAMGAVLRLVDSWLTGELEADREELIDWTTAAALGVLAGVASPAAPPGGVGQGVSH
ncbi:hypothetical protein [Streptomyces sp. NPDC101181]|uniref:hypothetical protein n=1 Tax=Streptomyces sp. NPDC101181 TaxID=3366125 RepID=UPI0037F7B565